MIHVVASRVGIADDECVTTRAGSGRHGATDRLCLAAVERQHPVGPPASEHRAFPWQIVVAAEHERVLRMEARETDVVLETPASHVGRAQTTDAAA